MQTFRLELENGAALTGVQTSPSILRDGPRSRPLLVAIHGAGYSSQYYDIDTARSGKKLSDTLEVPFVAIDRPGYQGSTVVNENAVESIVWEESGGWLHKFILPTLWREFGIKNGCTSMVLMCHSIASPSSLIAAKLHASEDNPKYPLAGLALSGVGCEFHPDLIDFMGGKSSETTAEDLLLPSHTTDAHTYDIHQRLRCPPVSSDQQTMMNLSLVRWNEWASTIKADVLIAGLEGDRIFTSTKEHLHELAVAFRASPRVEELFLPGAPHSIEISHWSPGWYARVFGFALDCAMAR